MNTTPLARRSQRLTRSNPCIAQRRYLVQKETDPIHEAMLQRKITPEEGRELFKRRRELLEQQNSQAAGGAQQSDGTAAK